FRLSSVTDTSTTALYTLSLHDALPISVPRREVAIDAPADPLALRADRDVLGHEKRAVTLDVDYDVVSGDAFLRGGDRADQERDADRKSTRLNSSHVKISYAVFCLKKKK